MPVDLSLNIWRRYFDWNTRFLNWVLFTEWEIIKSIRFKSPDYSSQKGKRFTKQNKKVSNSLNRKIFRRASKLLQSHWPRRYFLSLHISKQKIICKSILSWPVGFEKKNWSSCLMQTDTHTQMRTILQLFSGRREPPLLVGFGTAL